MANNIHKKLTTEDRFARKFFCQHSRLNSIRADKKKQSKDMRNINKKLCRELEE